MFFCVCDIFATDQQAFLWAQDLLGSNPVQRSSQVFRTAQCQWLSQSNLPRDSRYSGCRPQRGDVILPGDNFSSIKTGTSSQVTEDNVNQTEKEKCKLSVCKEI